MASGHEIGELMAEGLVAGPETDEAKQLQEVAMRRREIGADRGRTKVCRFRIHSEVHLMLKRLARLRGQSVGKLWRSG